MTRPIHIWIIFVSCFLLLLAGMGWVSWTALKLDRAQGESQRQAEFEEKVRLALWRMDSTLAPLIVQESSRPYFTYSSFFPAGRAYNKMFGELKPDEVLLPSPLLSSGSTNVLLHFQYGPDGRLTSPQVPTGNKRDLAESRYLSSQEVTAASARLVELQQLLKPDVLAVACVVTLPAPAGVASGTDPALTLAQVPVPLSSQLASAPQQQQVLRNRVEQQARANSYQQAATWNEGNNGALPRHQEVAEGMVKPIWFGDALVLARRVTLEGKEYVQGCWLDWPNIRRWMLTTVGDLLPNASLEPIRGPLTGAEGRLLASLPAHLIPGALALAGPPVSSPIRYVLLVGWLCVLLAGGAVGVLLHGAVSLSERRGAFVSAVTHELRTPLTTFKMYSEMLAEGMVTEPEKRQAYLRTLCSEANRLSHLVENVLAYACLERGSARSRVERLPLAELISRVTSRLAQRAEQAGLELVQDGQEDALKSVVQVDVAAVEQILFNLVDNACKYAGPGATEKLIHLEAFPDGKFTMLRVRDHGQGVSVEGARRLFQPFSKSAHEAAHSAPGVGLGLALCRRLSRSMGGDLQFERVREKGACFILKLPVCRGEVEALGAASIG